MCKWIVVVLLLLPAVPAGGQTPGQTVERHTLKSAELGDEREIWVALPRDYAAGSQRYPVLYVLDADGLFPPAAAYASYLPLGDAMPPLIVVGVRSKSMEDRNRVFTPAPGVADRFLAFLTKEVRPFVERTYRTQPVATLAGHSMAGLFAVYALATAPDSFDAYFAFSPVLAWRGGAALAPLEAFLRRERTTPKSLYLSVAHEPQFPQEPVERAVRLLEERAGPSLRWTFARFDGEDHFTTVPPALWGALRWLHDAPPDVRSGFVEVDGGRIFYEAAGAGQPVILLHDGLVHRETWDAQFGVLARSRLAVRYDRRGYGRSSAPTTPFSNMDDLLALMDALAVEKATLVGCSAGSLVAVHFALEHPERVASLVLVGPVVSGLEGSDHFRTRGGRWRPTAATTVEEKIDYWAARDPWLVAPASAGARARVRALLTANPQNLAVPSQLMRWKDGPALGRLGGIKVPTLIVVGEADIPDVHAHAGALQAGIAGASRVVLPGSGHLPHMEVPDAFNDAVTAFLGASVGTACRPAPRHLGGQFI